MKVTKVTKTAKKNKTKKKPLNKMVKKQDIFHTFIAVLNEAYAADPAAMHALICNRVPCNHGMATHTTIQVIEEKVASNPYYSLGLLGLINGICEATTGKLISAKFEKDENGSGHTRLVGFEEYRSDQPKDTKAPKFVKGQLVRVDFQSNDPSESWCGVGRFVRDVEQGDMWDSFLEEEPLCIVKISDDDTGSYFPTRCVTAK